MDAQLDLLCFDLFDFDMKHPVFPGNALMFMIQMTCINIPQDHIPVFSDLYNSKVGTPSDFKSVDFYSDFSRLMGSRIWTTDLQEALIKFFEVSFIPDPTIDLLCAEAFRPSPTIQVTPASKKNKARKTPDSKPSPPARASASRKNKREKNYNSPLIRTRCDNCAEKDLRMKLMKKISTCNVGDLMKFDTFWGGVKIEKRQLATLPPVNEINQTMHQELITLMDNRYVEEIYYLNELLPDKLNHIKLDWYENRHAVQTVINVPDTESDT